MTVDAAQAAKAYIQAAQTNSGLAAPNETGASPSFGDLVMDSIGSAADTLRHSEEMSTKAIKNEAEIVDVVTAISAAELTLETIVAVRDKVVNAYQQIIRMPI